VFVSIVISMMVLYCYDDCYDCYVIVLLLFDCNDCIVMNVM
jgi:hypothetical protein